MPEPQEAGRVTDTDSHALFFNSPYGESRTKPADMQIYKNWLRRNSTPFQETSFGLAFQYQGGSFIIVKNSDDPDYFQLIMPGIMDVQGNLNKVLLAANTINQEIKCVKCTVPNGESVWMATEILLDKTPEIDSIMPRLLAMLHGARMRFRQEMI